MSDEIYRQRTPDWYAPYLARFNPLEGPFLELGAGHGLLLELVRSRGIEGHGVEYVKSRVDLCVSKGLNVRQHDLANRLPYEDERFSCIYCGQVIEHCPAPTQRMIVQEAFRVLKAGGQLFITSPCRHHEESRLQKDHEHLLTPTELKALIEEAGFSRITPTNRPQNIPEIPPDVVKDIWARYQPDILSETANAFCIK
ncbi:class I SAM-dependent methyltransferase [Reyranella soli]|uniref:Methyltransferase type 11 domain-containing protein n=1 Tax=Reyranella soli TaxID=1230389 RepID=A0A512NSQ6_9HYPH|nr:class I SAM-dependent methyltransferase [Reyranella soli]GEP61974.1 hypothetical protein RSO01_91400 [Reyranella soli]